MSRIRIWEYEENISSQVNAKTVSWVYALLPPALLAGAILPFVGWGFSDDDIFITAYLIGEPFPAPIWPHNGRYFPMGHQEWRLFYWATEAWEFHLFAVLQYAAFCLLLRDALWQLGVKAVSALLFVVGLPPVVVTFSHIVVPDRNQLFLWAFWLVGYLRWEAHRSILVGLLAVFCASLSLYYKEPTFLFYSGFVLVNILVSEGAKQGFWDAVRRHWCDIGVLLSCGMFAALYFRKMGFATLTSGNAYNGHKLDLSKILPTLKQVTVSEPLLIPLIVGGFALIAVGRQFKSRLATMSIGLWLGAFLYSATMIGSGLVGKYYYALPLTVFAIVVLVRLIELYPRNNWMPYLRCLIAFNVVLGVPAIVYKHDWTTRNRELVSAILERAPSGGGRPVAVGEADPWDAAMLILYANGIRKADIAFFCETPNMGIDWLGDFCPALHENQRPRTVVSLGQLYGERSATLWIDGKVEWKYASSWEKFVPAAARSLLKDHYNFQGPL